MKSIHSSHEAAKPANIKVPAPIERSSTGRRPQRSESAPQTGAKKNCATE